MTLTQEVYEKLRRDIYMLTWNEYSYLTESELAERYNVSKAPVREALYRLCREGMMESFPRRGYRIRVISDEEYEEIKKIRYANESLAIDLFMEKPDEKLLKKIEEAAKHSEDAGGNLSFHTAIAKAGGNQILIDMIDVLMHCVSRSITLLSMSMKEKPRYYHREIAEAMREGNAKAAKEYLRKDIGL